MPNQLRVSPVKVMKRKRLKTVAGAICSLVAFFVYFGAADWKLRRRAFLYKVGREITRAGIRPLPYRFDALPYAPTASSNTSRYSTLVRFTSLAQSAPDTNSQALALVLSGHSERAIQLLRPILIDNQDLDTWNTLAVAHMQHALAKDNTEELVAALAAVDRAISLGGRSAEAVFNRALILEALGLDQAASRGFRQVLEIDDFHSDWARETRERLRAHLQVHLADWNGALKQLRRAASDGNQSAVYTIVARFPQQSRTQSEGVDLADWAEAFQAGSATQEQPLACARAVGNALRQFSGEGLLADAVAAIDRAIASRNVEALQALAAGHLEYRRARMLYGGKQRRIGETLPHFAKARDLFLIGGSPMSMLAEYYRNTALFEQNSGAEALRGARAINTPFQYKALRAHIDWFTGTATGNAGHFYESYEAYRSALIIFQTLSEEQNSLRMRTEVAFVLTFLGRAPEAWRMRRTIFQGASKTGEALLIKKTLSTAAFDEMKSKNWSEAASLYNLITESIEPGTERLVIDALLWGSYAEDRAGLQDRSAQRIREANGMIDHLRDKSMAEAAAMDVRLIDGLVLSGHSPKRALGPLSDYIAYCVRNGRSFFMTDALLSRARAARASGNAIVAYDDLTHAASLIESRRQRVGVVELRDTFFGVAPEIYDELIDMQESSGDPAAAFYSLERARARAILDRISTGLAIPLPVSQLRSQMEAGKILVAYASLPRRLLIFILKSNELQTLSLPVSRERLAEASVSLLASIQRGDQAATLHGLNELHGWLIAPLNAYLHGCDTIVVVPDDTLASVPFAALRSQAGRYLVEDTVVVTAPSASVFNRIETLPVHQRRFIVAVGNPAFDRSAMPSLGLLPLAEKEAFLLTSAYGHGIALSGSEATVDRFLRAVRRADVVHLATHALVNSHDPWMSALVLAPSGRTSGLLYLSRIATSSFTNVDTVVLAGCQTGVSAGGTGAIRSLSAAFLAGGARSVIGTLWDVDDATSSVFARRLHKQLRSGVSPAVALRTTQLSLLQSTDHSMRQPQVWGAFQLLGSAR